MKETKSPESPCLRKCFLAECLTYCVGCGRTTEDIKTWRYKSPEEKIKALKEANKRKIAPVV